MKTAPSPLAVRPAVQEHTPVPAPKAKTSKPPQASGRKAVKLAKQQRLQELMPKAVELSQQNPGLHPHNAFEILLGQYTLEEWRVRRHQALERKKNRTATRYSDRPDNRPEVERAWCSRFFEGPDQEPVWMETARGDLVAQVTKVVPYILFAQNAVRRHIRLEKTKISVLCSAVAVPQVLAMREIQSDAQRDAVPATKPEERWRFPHDIFASWVGQRVRVQLLNGSSWTGFLRWASHHTFLLGAKPEGEPEFLCFKHACCAVQIVSGAQ